jgi:hypothetical protein
MARGLAPNVANAPNAEYSGKGVGELLDLVAADRLAVDLNPRLHGNHRLATIADCVTACRSCNSRRGLGEMGTAGRQYT